MHFYMLENTGLFGLVGLKNELDYTVLNQDLLLWFFFKRSHIPFYDLYLLKLSSPLTQTFLGNLLNGCSNYMNYVHSNEMLCINYISVSLQYCCLITFMKSKYSRERNIVFSLMANFWVELDTESCVLVLNIGRHSEKNYGIDPQIDVHGTFC